MRPLFDIAALINCFGRFFTRDCFRCLFNVSEPNGESHDLASSMPAMVEKLRARFDSYAKEYHPPSHPPAMETDEYCAAALHNGGFSAPWRPE